MPTSKRFSAQREIDGRILRMDFTLVTYRQTEWEPEENDIYDESYSVDGVVQDFLDLSDNMQEMRDVLIATASEVPYNFGPPGDLE